MSISIDKDNSAELYNLAVLLYYHHKGSTIKGTVIGPNFGEQSLDQYEKDLGFTPEWVDIDEAISTNKKVIDSESFPRWTPRELFVLEYIKDTLQL